MAKKKKMEEKKPKSSFGERMAALRMKKKGGHESMDNLKKKSISGSGQFSGSEMKQGYRKLGGKLDYSEDCHE
jgi:hypothetical protein